MVILGSHGYFLIRISVDSEGGVMIYIIYDVGFTQARGPGYNMNSGSY